MYFDNQHSFDRWHPAPGQIDRAPNPTWTTDPGPQHVPDPHNNHSGNYGYGNGPYEQGPQPRTHRCVPCSRCGAPTARTYQPGVCPCPTCQPALCPSCGMPPHLVHFAAMR